MISQADIIRTLVNKNCTDESIMSMALSPNCSPARLLEKFTEAERFDLALDVSMKLGLDTSPLWRTWAMRFLINRNFKAARDKFKLCFQRMNSKSGRSSVDSVSNRLLDDIIKELSRMEEQKLSLNDEIERIKRQNYHEPAREGIKTNKLPERESILEKPTIYNECIYYLREYGTIRDYSKFYVKQSLWELLIKALIDNRSESAKLNFFIRDVFLQSASTGHLDDLITVFLKTDPNLELSIQYFRLIYEFCTNQCRYNLLNYVQHKIGDHVAAAEGQINHYFLKRPALDYSELNKRLASLTKAIKDYQEYLKKLSDKKHSISMKNDLRRRDVVKNGLYSEMSYFNVELRISTIELQIELTKIFALNGVSGCISEIESNQDKALIADDDFPVTLFDRSERRKTFLAALVLVFFDPSCKSYCGPRALEMAKRVINKLQIDKLLVFKTAMQVIIEDESCDILESTGSLLERLKEEYKEDLKVKSRQPINLAPRRASSGYLLKQQMNKNLKHGQTSLSIVAAAAAAASSAASHSTRIVSTQESERISLMSDNSILSTATTASSSSAASQSSSPPLSINVGASCSSDNSTRPSESSGADKLRSSRGNKTVPSLEAFKEPPVEPSQPTPPKNGNSCGQSKLTRRDVSQKPCASSSSFSSVSQALERDNSFSQLSLSASLSSRAIKSPLDEQLRVRVETAIKSERTPVTAASVLPHKRSAVAEAAAMAAAREHAATSSLFLRGTNANADATIIGNLSVRFETAQALCDEVISDSIKGREADFAMELAKLLSPKAKLELYIEMGKLSNAQRLAFSMNWPDYVVRIIEEAEKLSQHHVKAVCQHWLAKHDSNLLSQ